MIPSYNSSEEIGRCIHALREQEVDVPYEIIVVDSSNDSTGETLESYEDIKLIRMEKRCYPGTGRNIGVQHAKGRIICFTDADCVPPRNWLRSIYELRPDENGLAIGGPILNGTPDSLIGSASYFSTFSSFMPRPDRQTFRFLATANLALAKTHFHTVGSFRDFSSCKGEDVLFGEKCKRAGIKVTFCPSVSVVHMNRTSLASFLAHQRSLGRGSGDSRMLYWLPGSVVARVPLFWPLVPGVRFLRIVSRSIRYGVGQRKNILKSLPLILLGSMSYGLGFVQGACQGYISRRKSYT